MTQTTDRESVRQRARNVTNRRGLRHFGRRRSLMAGQSAGRVVCWSLLIVMSLSLLATDQLSDLLAQPAETRRLLPAGARPLTIVVESIRGTVRYRRDSRFRRLTRRTRLQQGDLLVLDVAAACQLRFELSPPSDPVGRPDKATDQSSILPVNYQEAPAVNAAQAIAAIVLRGYTEITVAEAYAQGGATRTQLDMRQGVIRAGVVRTAVPPSFRIRTPRSVVAVRGTEIREIEASSDRGDFLQMGQIGVTTMTDGVPLTRSVQAEQGSRKEVAPDRRRSRLMRAIENAVLGSRLVIRRPYKSGLEVDQSRRAGFDPLVFSKAEPLKINGNPRFDAQINAGPGTSSFFEGGGGDEGGGIPE